MEERTRLCRPEEASRNAAPAADAGENRSDEVVPLPVKEEQGDEDERESAVDCEVVDLVSSDSDYETRKREFSQGTCIGMGAEVRDSCEWIPIEIKHAARAWVNSDDL